MASALEPASLSLTSSPSLDSTKAVKAVKFGYTPTPLTRELLETFRDMVNEAIRICLKEGINGRLKVRPGAQAKMKQ
ncbi:MAG TPA: hypothetical protein VKF39_06100 [Nitrososphaerales archaeon]|nr:hypothetical protein [Nitrososphaerales archaeon]